jgi:putative membrane protein
VPEAPAAPDRDPDVRFLLANERTLLAWLRTGLALQGGGLLVVQLATGLDAREVIGVVLLAAGALCHLTGWRRFRAADRAIRANRLPARGLAPDLIALTMVALSLAAAVAVLR